MKISKAGGLFADGREIQDDEVTSTVNAAMHLLEWKASRTGSAPPGEAYSSIGNAADQADAVGYSVTRFVGAFGHRGEREAPRLSLVVVNTADLDSVEVWRTNRLGEDLLLNFDWEPVEEREGRLLDGWLSRTRLLALSYHSFRHDGQSKL